MARTQQMYFSRAKRWEAGTRLRCFKNNDLPLAEWILPGWQIRSGLPRPQPQPQATSSAAVHVRNRFPRNDPIKLLDPEVPQGQSKLNLK